jgi:hypothetical protein
VSRYAIERVTGGAVPMWALSDKKKSMVCESGESVRGREREAGAG